MAAAACRQVLGLGDLTAMPTGAALGLFCGPTRVPLAGVAGLVDWRLCGALSRARLAGLISGRLGERLLVPASGRLAPGRIFLFGTGRLEPSAAWTDDDLAALGAASIDVMARAGAQPIALAAPHAADAELAPRFAAACQRVRPDQVMEVLVAPFERAA